MFLRFNLVLIVMVLMLGVALEADAGTVLIQDFEDPTWDEQPDQTIAEAIEALREAHPYLVDVRSLDMTRTNTAAGFSGKGLHVEIPTGGYRGFGPYARLVEPVEEAWFRYYVKLVDFQPVSSGKLPGLADASVTVNAKGCKPSTTEDPGWSARLMFDAAGTAGAGPTEVPIGLYLYHLDQAGSCGDELMFDTPLRQQRWTCIEGHVKMNTPGTSNGSVQAWVDGKSVMARSGVAFRRAGETNVAVRELWNNVYFGGRYPTPNPLSLTLDEMVVSDSGRVGCIDPFDDDNDSVHESDLTETYARGLLFGCDDNKACPLGVLTRAEFAALIHRVIDTPAGPDSFRDDDGHWAESVLNSVAQAGIIRGCNPPTNDRACPDAPVTRAEVAAMVKRALSLPNGPDAFGDDNGHWAEADINALAASGITKGCAFDKFCPDRTMLRQEAATFILRVDDQLVPLEIAADVPEWPPPGPPPVIPPEERE